MSLFDKARRLLHEEALHFMKQVEEMKTQYDIYEHQIAKDNERIA
jgi:hypothetical protein